MFSSVLSDEQIQRIHDASMALLSRVGVVVPHPDMLSRLEEAGAQVDHDAQRVRLSEELVLSLIAQAGKHFTLYGRDLTKTAAFGQGQRNYNSIAGEACWLEAPGDDRRYATLGDAATAGRFADGLAHINLVGAMSDPQELPAAGRCVAVLATLLRTTTKPVTFWYHDRASARYVNEILIALRGDEARAARYPLCYRSAS